jgi:hypothetical protein
MKIFLFSDIYKDEDVFLPSFLEATSAFEGANETIQPKNKPPSPMPLPSRIPKFMPKPKKVPTAVPAAARHSSPMKQVVKIEQPICPPTIKIDRPLVDTNTRGK